MSPAGAVIGLPVFAETIEGRACVARDNARRPHTEAGTIRITIYTDPSETPPLLGH